jgi:hypothetical protein
VPGWNVVAHGDFNGNGLQDLVIQNPTSGAVDFLFLDSTGHAVGSALSPVALPHIVGAGNFNNGAGQSGPTLVTQLANGQLDMVGYNNGTPVHSDLIANTVGLPSAIGVGESYNSFPLLSRVGGGGNDGVMLQLADGSLDAIGFSGSFASDTLSTSASYLLPGSAGLPSVGMINPDDAFNNNKNLPGGAGAGGVQLEGVQMISRLSNGGFDALYANSGYGDPTHEGSLYASALLNLNLPGWHLINAGGVATELLPVT